MEMIQIYNRQTGETLERTFTDHSDANDYKFLLDFLEACYKRFYRRG